MDFIELYEYANYLKLKDIEINNSLNDTKKKNKKEKGFSREVTFYPEFSSTVPDWESFGKILKHVANKKQTKIRGK